MQSTVYRIIALQNDETDCRVINTLFNRAEFDLTAFDNGREFIKYMRMQPCPDCLITDLELDETAGIEVIERIRRDARWQSVPIIVLAPSVDKSTLVKLSQLKIKGYIVRPYQPQRLFNEVLSAMGLEVVTQKTAVKRVKTKP